MRQDTLGTRTYVHTLAAQVLGIDVDQTDQASIDAAAAYVEAAAHTLNAVERDFLDRRRAAL